METAERPHTILSYEDSQIPDLEARLAKDLYDIDAMRDQARVLFETHTRPEHKVWLDEPENNSRTALFEALTAKGHLSRVVFYDEVDEVNQLTLGRLLNGYSEGLPEWERNRRFDEIVEELTVQRVWADIQAGRLPGDTIVATISDYPEGTDDIEAWRMGYRNLNHKGMARTHHFETAVNGTWLRVQEQVSRSNSNDGSSQETLHLVDPSYDSRSILSNQVITSRRELPDGVVSLQKMLDRQAGEHIRYGEDSRITNPPLPDYDDLRNISMAREHQAYSQIHRLADWEREVDAKYQDGQITYEQKLAELKIERDKLIDEICILDPSYALDARGQEAAAHYENAAIAMASGNDVAGVQYLAEARRTADPLAAPVCGGDGLAKENRLQDATNESIYQKAKMERRNWVWKKGVCLVEECPTRPSKTDVGPCSVCRKCQTIYDNGDDPEKTYRALGFLDWLFGQTRNK